MKPILIFTIFLTLISNSFAEPKAVTEKEDMIIYLNETDKKTVSFTYKGKVMSYVEFITFLMKEENRKKNFIIQTKGGKRKKLSEILNAVCESKVPYKKINEVIDYALSIQEYSTKRGKGYTSLYQSSNKHKIIITIYGIVDKVAIKSFVNKLKAEQEKNNWIRIDITFYEKENFIDVDNGWKKRANEKEIYKTILEKIEPINTE